MNCKKMIAMVTASILCGSMLAACGKEPAPSPAATDTAAAQESTASVEGAESMGTSDSAKTDSPSWTQDTSDCTITWFFAYDWYDKKFDETVNAFDKKLYDNTGCRIEIQTGDTDKLNMLIKTGKLPDVITLDANSTQRKLLEDNGLVQPLETLRDQYAPDLVVPQSMIDWYRNKDGHWYSIASFYYGEDNVRDNNGYFETHNQNFVRDDILKQIGMTYDELRTKDGFLKALRAVKEQGIIYNDVKVTPYAALFNDKAAEQMAEQFGASYEDKDGNYQSIYEAPEFREAMLFFNQMYREGLLTDDSFTMDKSQLEQEVAAGHVFATTAWTNVSLSRNSLYANDPDAKMLYAGLLKGDTHDQVMVAAKDNMGWTATMVNKDAKNPERIIRMFAYLNTPEATIDAEWGAGGWTMNENGHVVRDPEVKKLSEENPNEFTLKYSGNMGWTSDYTIIQGTYPEDSGAFTEDVYNRTHDDSILIYDDKCFSDTAPDSGSEEAAIMARIQEYRTQSLSKIITAPTSEQCEAELDNMLKELDNLGMQQLNDYKNTRFQENKEKLGVKFVFPGNK